MYIEDKEEAENWAEYFGSLPVYGYDTETTGLDPIKTRIRFFSFSDHDVRIAGPVRLLEVFRDTLEDPEVAKRMTNAKVDLHWTANHGIIIRGPIEDTIPADWLFDENRIGRHGLKDCARDHLGLRMSPFKQVFGNVGKTDNEVRMLCRIHDILEGRRSDEASDVLVALGKATGDEQVIKILQKLHKSVDAGFVLKNKQLLKMARDTELAARTTGKAGYILDFLNLVGDVGHMPAAERESLRKWWDDPELAKEAHEVLQYRLRKRIQIDRDPLDYLRLIVGDYASLDAWSSNALVEQVYQSALSAVSIGFDEEEEEEVTLLDFYENTSKPFTRVLWNMERRGMSIDLEAAAELERPMREAMGKVERKIIKAAGADINVNSTKDLLALLFTYDEATDTWLDPFGDPPVHMTSGGESGIKKPSTKAAVLEGFAERGLQVAKDIVEFRKLAKLHGTYVDKVRDWVDLRGRAHTSLNQSGTVSGRLSSSKPNLQNIPAKGEAGRQIRQLFVAGTWGVCDPQWCMDELVDVPVPSLPDDFPMTLIVADYKQLEMRIMAHFCLHRNMAVTLAGGGKMPIGQMVRDEWCGEVESYNFETGEKIPCAVVAHFKNGAPVRHAPYRGGLRPEDWTVLRHEGAPWMKLIATDEHYIYRPNGARSQLKDLKIGDSILFDSPNLQGGAFQMVLGSLLGDGNFKKGRSKTSEGTFHGASFYHSNKQEAYFRFKEGVLAPWTTRIGHDGKMHRGHLRASFQLERLWDAMYKGGKKCPTIAALMRLDPRGLAIWYADDGNLSRDSRCQDPTKGFCASIANVRITEEEVDFLGSLFDLPFRKWKNGFGVCGENAEKFLRLIEPHMPASMKYKVPEHLRTEETSGWDESVSPVTPVKIIEKRAGRAGEAQMGCGAGSKYDITVEESHKYFAQGLLVSNSGDPSMIDAIRNGQDLHCKTAERAAGYDYEDVVEAKKAVDGDLDREATPRDYELVGVRSNMKAVGFGLIYGIGAVKLGRQLGFPVSESLSKRAGRVFFKCPKAEETIKSYFSAYPYVKEWIDQTHEDCANHLFVQTYTGRFRRLPDIDSSERGLQAMARRQSVNSIIQGSAADLTNEAMIRCESDPELRRLGVRMLLQVHDELVFEVPDDPKFIEPAKKRIKELMEYLDDLEVPIEISMGTGANWEDAK